MMKCVLVFFLIYSIIAYVVTLKGNHSLFYQELQDLFSIEEIDSLKKKLSCYFRIEEKNHSGITIREYYQTDEIGWYTEKDKWKSLKRIRKTIVRDCQNEL